MLKKKERGVVGGKASILKPNYYINVTETRHGQMHRISGSAPKREGTTEPGSI